MRNGGRPGVLIALAGVLIIVGAVAASAATRSSGRGAKPSTTPGVATTASATAARPRPSAATRPTTRRPTPATTSPEFKPRSFAVLAAGDILLHDGLWKQAARDATAEGKDGYDFGPLLAGVQPAVSRADLAICHLETPVGPPEGPFTNFPVFSVPPQIAPAIAETGFDTCSTASNHSLDGGEAGIDRTLDALDAAGVKHTGTARSAAEAAKPDLLQVRGVTVAQLSYTFGFNGIHRPADKPWLANLTDVRAILAAAHKAKAAGADVVILSLHWGTEYSHAVDDSQSSLARKLLASPDIDLIIGCHTHVVEPMEKINGKWVVYGMGNLVAYQQFSPDTRDGIMPEFTFTEVSPHKFQVSSAVVRPVHMWLDSKPVRLYDVASTVDNPAVPAAIRASAADSRDRTLAVLGQRGAFQAGLQLATG
jgi:poly-gamma-glutamate synthesis protein (capsule biosynthesis protein)